MLFRELIERRSNHTTWFLAIVIFLSGFSLSLSTEHVHTTQAKAKTELVFHGTTKSKKAYYDKQSVYPPGLVATLPSFNSNSVFFQNELDRVQFKGVTKTRQHFIPMLNARYLPIKTPESRFAYALG